MNASRLSSVGVVLGLLLSNFSGALRAAAPTTAPATRPAGEPIAQLAKGNKPGTFHLVYGNRVHLSIDGDCALIATISDFSREKFPPAAVDPSRAFTVEADVRPGTYSLAVSAADSEHPDYWPSDSQRLHVDTAGRLYGPWGWLSPAGEFTVVRQMKGLSPSQIGIADARQPILRWPNVAGATHYQGSFERNGQRYFDVDETQFVIGGEIPAGESCWWRVEALDANRKILARGESTFFGKGTDPEMIAKMRAEGGSCSINEMPAGRSYLGFRPFPANVPKDATTPFKLFGSGMTSDEEASMLPGIKVNEVFTGSPAADADKSWCGEVFDSTTPAGC